MTTNSGNGDIPDDEFKSTISKLPTEIQQVLLKHKAVFKSKLPPGLHNKYKGLKQSGKSVIPTTTDEPVWVKRRRLSPKETDELRAQVDDHLSRQIIQDSQSPYNAPLVFVQKI